jgi:hypothetical protein
MRRTTFAVALLCTASAWADCPDGVYNFTDQDKKFMIDTVAAVRSALPPAPDGWSMRDPLMAGVRPGAPMPAWAPPSSACKGANSRPLITGYTVKYVWGAGRKDLEQKQNEIRKRISVLQHTPLPADQQKLATEAGNKDRDLRYQARKFEKTDKAEADRLKAAAAVYRKQYDAINQAHFAKLKPDMDALQKEEADVGRGQSSLEVEVGITVNSQGDGLTEMTPTKAQAGADFAFTGLNQFRVNTTLLLYGVEWKKDTNAMFAVFPSGANINKAHNIVVTAAGDPKQVELILPRLDAAALKKLLGK